MFSRVIVKTKKPLTEYRKRCCRICGEESFDAEVALLLFTVPEGDDHVVEGNGQCTQSGFKLSAN
jgi:hypothetical protein